MAAGRRAPSSSSTTTSSALPASTRRAKTQPSLKPSRPCTVPRCASPPISLASIWLGSITGGPCFAASPSPGAPCRLHPRRRVARSVPVPLRRPRRRHLARPRRPPRPSTPWGSLSQDGRRPPQHVTGFGVASSSASSRRGQELGTPSLHVYTPRRPCTAMHAHSMTRMNFICHVRALRDTYGLVNCTMHKLVKTRMSSARYIWTVLPPSSVVKPPFSISP